jgi:predicted NUDIX family NTP pyrophosphohydrolase
MPKRSAGLLPYRFRKGVLEVFLVHPGGPYWAKKDLGAWSIPQGEYDPGKTRWQWLNGNIKRRPAARLSVILSP